LLSYILFEKYINILALKMASQGNRHCASFIGAHPQCRQRTAIVLLQLQTITHRMLNIFVLQQRI